MKFRQKLQRSISLRFTRNRKKKSHISENVRTNVTFKNIETSNCCYETEEGCNLNKFQETSSGFDKSKSCHPVIDGKLMDKQKYNLTSKSTVPQVFRDELSHDVNRNSMSSKLMCKSEDFHLEMVPATPNCSSADYLQDRKDRSKRSVFYRTLSRTKRIHRHGKMISSSKPMVKLSEKMMLNNLKSHILANMTEIAVISNYSSGQTTSQQKNKNNLQDNKCMGDIKNKPLKEDGFLKNLNLQMDLQKGNPLITAPKTEDLSSGYDSMPFRIKKELSPTCADIYGIDEVDNVSFEKLSTDRDFVHTLGPKTYSGQKEQCHFVGSVEEYESNRNLFFNTQNTVEARNTNNKANYDKNQKECFDAQSDKVSEKMSKDMASKEVLSPTAKTREISEMTSLRSLSQALSSDEQQVYENPWVLQENKKKFQEPQKVSNIEIESSLGFEVNHSADLEETEIKVNALARSDSTESIDSFGSSYHSVGSMKDVYFSDSEAEHIVDEILEFSADSGAEKRNSKSGSDPSEKTVETLGDPFNKSNSDTFKIPEKTDKKESKFNQIVQGEEQLNRDSNSLSDSDSDQKQLIPYALSENFGSNVTVRKKKKKKLHRSFDEKLDDSFTLEKYSGEKKTKLMKSLSSGLPGESEYKQSDKSKHNRRSLDSSLAHRNILNELQSPEKRRSVLNSSAEFLSPVLEGEVKESKTGRGSNQKLDKNIDPTRFFTLPNPKKLKSQQSNLKKRLGSVSKLISDKAQSISNLKMGASFKLRKEIEKSKELVSSSANSFSDLMTKKASSFSTLIRRRTNSNTVIESPFKQFTRKVNRVKDEDKTELVYEKIRVKVPAKRPVTTLEQTARSKRLRVSLRLAKNASKSESERYEDEIRSRSNSYIGRPWSSESFSPLRSPTLLDEIMKSVDTAGVMQRCSVANGDLEASDCEESSSGSSLFLFQKQYSLDSDTKDIAFMAVCRVCGKVRNPSDRSSDSSESLVMRKNCSYHRFSLSLCDLNATCQCFRHDRTCKQRFSCLPFTEADSKKSLESAKRRSWAVISDFKGTSADEINSGNIFRKRKMLNSAQRPASMFELRQSMDETTEKVKFEMGETENRERMGSSDALPGTLLRHRPLLDLSGENLDETLDSEDGVNDVKGESYGQRSHSCGDLIDTGRYFENEITEKDTVKIRVKNEKEDDTESFHSCSETVESETDLNDFEHGAQPEKQKSNSCSNLLDENEVNLGDKLKEQEQRKRELRKMKVKSMSSSHDALSELVPLETINIDEVEISVAKNHGKSKGKDNAGKDNQNGQLIVNGIIELAKNGLDTELNSVVTKTNGITKNLEHLVNDEDNKENFVCQKCNCMRWKANQMNSLEKDGVEGKLISKPPLPHQRWQNKVLSLSDISNHDNREHQSFRRQKVFSMTELDREQNNVNLCKCDLGVTEKIVIGKNKTLSESRNTPKSASLKTPISRFLFDEQHVGNYIKTVSKLDRQKSISSDNVTADSPRKSGSEILFSACSLNRLSKNSWSDEVFSRLSFPLSIQLSPYVEFFESTPVKGFSRLSGPRVTSPGMLPELPELPSLTEECVYKYDVCLGYLLHSVQCDNKMICVYSLQRNKQLMESVITPLTASPQTPHRKPHEHGSVNKNKAQHKARVDELPNPAAPITSVPSDRLAHAGLVLRTVLLARAPHMIRDRKFHLRTYRRCMVGTEMVDWLLQQSALVHSRTQAVGMWQALVEEGVVVHVCHEHQFKDKYLFYRFHEDDEGVSTVPSSATKRECEEDLPDVFLMLAHIGPDAMMRMILRKPPHERTSEDLEIIYEELLHIKALSHLSTMVKRELASVLLFESHAKSGTVLFNQGDEGKSWYIILKGSVNVVIYGKGVVCTLHEGDDFGKLALVNDAPRAATIVLRNDNCHFLRVDKEDFNRILRDVEANTVRLKEHGQDVLVLEKIPSNTQTADGSVQAHYKYSVMAGTPEKMLEHLLESRLDSKNETEIDGFLEDFLLTHVIFMPCNHLCPVLLSHYHSSSADSTEQEGFEFMLNHKKCVLHFVQEWANIVGMAFKEDHTINAFLEELISCVQDDLQDYPTLKSDLAALETILNTQSGSPSSKVKRRVSGSFTLSRKHSKECFQDLPHKRKPISPSEETIFKVYCADHTYSTLKLPMDTKVEQLLMSTKEKLGLGDDLILCEVKSTGERLIFKENDLCVTTGLSVNGRLFVTPKEHLDALTPLPEQEGPSEGSFSTIEMFSSREMAYHMTLYDWELFTCVQEYELIYQVFGRYKFGKITANLDLFLQRFNEIQFWVVTEMVLTCNLSKRVSLLRKFIKLAAHCKEFKNLNSFFAIVMGLSNIAVSRLSQTWEKLPSKFKKMFEDFETLMDPSRNHRVYRLSVAKMLPPILPFMPLLMKDMTFTHEGNKTYFDGLVNFEKMHMIAQTLKTVRFCRSAHLDLEAPGTLKSSDTGQYIRSLKVIDNQRLLTQLSHKLEPRKT